MIVQAAMAEAAATGTPVAELSLDRIARRAGMSRSTVYRRMRTRRALDDAVREAGGDPGSRVGVRERAIAAATELIVADGVAALTVEAVTRRVGCAATSVYAAFGDREGLLAAVFDRHAPLPVVEELLVADPRTVRRLRIRRARDLHRGVRQRRRRHRGAAGAVRRDPRQAERHWHCSSSASGSCRASRRRSAHGSMSRYVPVVAPTCLCHC